MVLKLYKLDASPPARAAMIVLDALKIQDVEYIDVNLLEADHMKEEYLKINPQHTIPTLADEDFTIWDSHAIATYLISMYASDDSLYPRDPKKRAIIDQRLHFDSGILFPALRGSVAPVIFGGETAIRPENIEKMIQAYDFTEKFLDKPYLAGDQLTVADICAGATISSLNEVVPIDANKYPKLKAWLARITKEDFFKNANAPGVEQFSALIKSKLA